MILLKIVSFSRVVPFEGIPHAGGEYYLRHLDCLLEKHEVLVVVPDSKRNREALDRNMSAASFVLAPELTSRIPLGALVSRLMAELFPVSAPMALVAALRTNRQVINAIREADIVEFQWSENSSLMEQVRTLNDNVRTIVVMHDILKQKYARRLTTATTLKTRIRARVAYFSAFLLESRRLRGADAVITLSEKDRQLVTDSKGRPPTYVVSPPLSAIGDVEKSERIPFSVLFTGAMNRPENDHGIQWFVEQCWPMVIRSLPSATLTIAGADPSDKLLSLVADQPSILVTGYVEDLDILYTRSSAFVVPLFQGAGVKFKTITAMLNGLPVISTIVGAEGVGDSALYSAVTDSPDDFSAALIRVLSDHEHWRFLSNRALHWSNDNYGTAKFQASLDRIYGEKVLTLPRRLS